MPKEQKILIKNERVVLWVKKNVLRKSDTGSKLDRVENLKYLSGTGVRSRSKKLSGAGVPSWTGSKILSTYRGPV